MVYDQPPVVAERGKHPGVRHTPHGRVHRILVLLKSLDTLVDRGRAGAERWGGGGGEIRPV